MSTFHAALDLSRDTAMLAAADAHGNVLLETTRPMRGREAAVLSEWIVKSLCTANIQPETVASWTLGSGPGSFTGMRLAAAFLEGWRYGKPQLRVRCVPSALGLAAEFSFADGEPVLLLFDGRNRELLTFPVRFRGACPEQDGEPGILDARNAQDAVRGRRLAALNADRAPIEALLPEAHVDYAAAFRASSLLPFPGIAFDNDLTRLLYLRPAVQAKGEQA